MAELKIRFDDNELKYYVYANDAWGNCVFQSDSFDSLFEAEAYRQDQLDSAEYSE